MIQPSNAERDSGPETFPEPSDDSPQRHWDMRKRWLYILPAVFITYSISPETEQRIALEVNVEESRASR